MYTVLYPNLLFGGVMPKECRLIFIYSYIFWAIVKANTRSHELRNNSMSAVIVEF